MGQSRRTRSCFVMGGLCSKKKIADADTENNENEENTDKTPVGERRPTKGAGLLGKTEWTDDEDEDEEGAVAEEAPVENQAEENQAAQADVPQPAGQSAANENVEISDEPIQEATKTETLQPVEAEESPAE